jgi:hypothetical protein
MVIPSIPYSEYGKTDGRVFLLLFLCLLMSSDVLAWPFDSKSKSQPPLEQPRVLAPPAWYGQLSTSDGMLIGYGHAVSREEALGLARKDIAGQIRSHITAEDHIETRKTGERVAQSFVASAIARSDVTLGETELVKDERVQSSWYVAVALDYSPLSLRLLRKAGFVLCRSDEARINPYVRNTALFRDVAGELKCEPRFRLIRNDGMFLRERYWWA